MFPAASRLSVIVLLRSSPNTVSFLVPGEKVAVTAIVVVS
jgi:hypothetical protein